MKVFNLKFTPIVSLLFLCSTALLHAQQTEEKFVQETKYLLYLPEGYTSDTAARWPLMIFLHGSGERGDDLSKVKVHGPAKLIEHGRKFPFIVVSPQAAMQNGWRVEVLKGMLDDLKKKYRVDNARVYMTGLSMGGYGTWAFASKYPDDLAAIAPICGGGDPEEAWKIRRLPVWCFHGAKDDVVPPSESQKMVDALKKYNANVKYTLYPDANHNSWDSAYGNDSLYSWLLSHKKFRHTEIKVTPASLQEFEGTYVNEAKKDTLRLVMEDEKLFAKPGKNSIPLKAGAGESFYWDENSTGELIFERDKKKSVVGFLLLTGKQDRFKKLPAASSPKK
jgi:dienelactone hydrolase